MLEEHAKYASQLQVYEVDMGHISSIRAFCNALVAKGDKIKMLVLCPGCNYYSLTERTEDELEYSFGTMYAANFLITMLVLPIMQRSTPGVVLCLLPSSPKSSNYATHQTINLHLVSSVCLSDMCPFEVNLHISRCEASS